MPRGVTWGSFMGGFRLDATNANGSTGCKRTTHSAVVGADVVDYIPHHAWFQYYASTANPKHERPSSLAAIGYSLEHDGTTRDPANHNYDLTDFYDAVKAGNFPSVSYIKMPAYRGRPCRLFGSARRAGRHGDADQFPRTAAGLEKHRRRHHLGRFRRLVRSRLHQSDEPIVRRAKPISSTGRASAAPAPRCPALAANRSTAAAVPARGFPFLVISPWAKPNYVGHGQISFASVVRFIEDNWLHGATPRRRLVRRHRRIDQRPVRLLRLRQDCGALSRSEERHAASSAAASGRRALTGTRQRSGSGKPAWSSPQAPSSLRPRLWVRRPRFSALACGGGAASGRKSRDSVTNPHPIVLDASAGRAAVGHGGARPADFLRCKPVVIRQARLRILPQSAACLRAARRSSGHARRPATVAPRHARGAVADLSGASAELRHRTRQ